MKRIGMLTLGLTLCINATVQASDPIGIYALVDKVVLEPNEKKPERIQLWGAFSLGKNDRRSYQEPRRGCLYFSLVTGREEVCRKEWSDWKRLAGTGECVGFGSREFPMPRLHKRLETDLPTVAVDAQHVAKLIADLDQDQFAKRQKAIAEIEKLGKGAVPALRKALENKASPEVRRRLREILEKISPTPDVYPLAFGLQRMRRDSNYAPIQELLKLQKTPAPSKSKRENAARSQQ